MEPYGAAAGNNLPKLKQEEPVRTRMHLSTRNAFELNRPQAETRRTRKDTDAFKHKKRI